ncbi:hypothetical protein PPL_03562 [Heterostelium album PN500]|uniref:Uncharacterized protein n=1 Tax=Heterostelium pallidum (strain ATCC 26659 / Pp 5 / PN500) TaxID=670386 RepID=D3B551_HETP5|nr:hypothetical protein PPL_03562 [Heterostelium album PN500]EFA83416.1 hypothetical protein PPL_03562 [Heterostelium album PN500]|eukprot:XP_020435533.1 hypothetical protein PPL_03562 [Heterostelium album PN500]
MEIASSTMNIDVVRFVYENKYRDLTRISSNVSFYGLLMTLSIEFVEILLTNNVYNYSQQAFIDFTLQLTQMNPEKLTWDHLQMFNYIHNRFESKSSMSSLSLSLSSSSSSSTNQKSVMDFCCEAINLFDESPQDQFVLLQVYSSALSFQDRR